MSERGVQGVLAATANAAAVEYARAPATRQPRALEGCGRRERIPLQTSGCAREGANHNTHLRGQMLRRAMGCSSVLTMLVTISGAAAVGEDDSSALALASAGRSDVHNVCGK